MAKHRPEARGGGVGRNKWARVRPCTARIRTGAGDIGGAVDATKPYVVIWRADRAAEVRMSPSSVRSDPVSRLGLPHPWDIWLAFCSTPPVGPQQTQLSTPNSETGADAKPLPVSVDVARNVVESGPTAAASTASALPGAAIQGGRREDRLRAVEALPAGPLPRTCQLNPHAALARLKLP